MASRSFAPLSGLQENILGRAGVLRVHKPGERAVLAPLTEYDQNYRVCDQVSSKLEPALHDISRTAACADHVTELELRSANRSSELRSANRSSELRSANRSSELRSANPSSFLLPSELQLLDDAVQDLCSGSCMDASMCSLLEEAASPQDVLCVPEYAEDIHRYLRECEVKYRPKPGYMRKQPDISNGMRLVLIDWMVEVGEEYKLCSETLFLAVGYLDRFLSCMSVLRGKLQLVGTAAMLLAAKYEEVYPPEVEELVYITDDTYSKAQLLRMEQTLLRVLAFDMTAPTAHEFLQQYGLEEPICARTASLAQYLSELSLLEVEPFLQFLPSKMAAAAFCLANYTLNGDLWPESLYAFTGYSLSVIGPCLKALHKLHLSAQSRPQQAIQEKYKSSKFCGVSLMEPVPSLPIP
ncbi:cyclin-A1 [Pseudorasbora parva]|uniref:cyclin-A1 n=1 Tax=Pseudorasbora parva TaxID=51549 RepID=UPI00351F0376